MLNVTSNGFTKQNIDNPQTFVKLDKEKHMYVQGYPVINELFLNDIYRIIKETRGANGIIFKAPDGENMRKVDEMRLNPNLVPYFVEATEIIAQPIYVNPNATNLEAIVVQNN